MEVIYVARQSRQHRHFEEYFIIPEGYALGRSKGRDGFLRGYWFNQDKPVVQNMTERVKSENLHSTLPVFTKTVVLDDSKLSTAISLGRQISNPTQDLIGVDEEYSHLMDELFRSAAEQILPQL